MDRQAQSGAGRSPAPQFAAIIGCPVCDAPPEQHLLLFHKQGARFVRCPACTFEFVNPRPTDGWIEERYRFCGTRYYTEDAKVQSDFSPGRFRYQLARLEPPRGKLLDVGCATGAFVAAARNAGFVASGIDVSAESTRYGRERLGLDLDVGDLYRRAYPVGSFDVITFWETLEHLVDPGRFLKEAGRLLAPGGRLALSVPNHLGISERLLGRRSRYVGIDHLNYFTSATMRRLLERFRFTVERVETSNFNPIVLWRDLRRDASTLEQHAADRGLTDRLKSRRSMLSRSLRLAYRLVTWTLGAAGLGDALYVVARRTDGRR